MTCLAMWGKSTVALDSNLAAMNTMAVETAHSAITLEYISCWRKWSTIASLIWSQSLSGWPSVTDSDVKIKSFSYLLS